MSRLPLPPSPAALATGLRMDEDIVAVHPATRLVRIFNAEGRHRQTWDSFRYTGPLPHGRFDPQQPDEEGGPTTDPENGVLYFGLSARTGIAEVYQATSTVDRVTRAPHVAVIRPVRTLRLLDLTGLWPTRMGASQEIASGPKKITQVWARAIRAAYPDLDGLWYPSSMDSGNPAICLWDPSARSALPSDPDLLLPLSHPGLDMPIARVCNELNYVMYG
ncbi:RES family NAD+ phosphorylase [Haloechinothrix sp. LS1_15]|uniref:RES family NAD+ phosphorylase n=1 Tax=Haloechinothrix sp. LS1_15 TaxID=2652248 RepID=UPI002945CFAD|nr:RES family NAD+ phosphorylase [Haloechinothrix sp. LS1_15]MDV6012247.1 RES family NAD+ phosphorylase [Haloechinothrix sp. LS1_15]